MDERSQNLSRVAGGRETYDARRLNDTLAGARFGRALAVGVIDSTNTALFELARSGEPEGLVLVSEEQLAGRGRLGRKWVSPKGKSILMSMLVRASVEPQRAGLLNAVAGLAVVDAVQAECGIEVDLKWPNDIVAYGKKLGGILTDAGTDREGRQFWVVGIGLNVNWSAGDFPQEIADTATSLSIVAGAGFDRTALAASIARFFGDGVSELESSRETLLARYRKALKTLGKKVRVELPNETIVGVADDIDDSGDLIVITDRGERRLVLAGDVFELRPA